MKLLLLSFAKFSYHFILKVRLHRGNFLLDNPLALHPRGKRKRKPKANMKRVKNFQKETNYTKT